MLKNFKYYAGLADADAYLGLSFNKSTNGCYSVYAVVKYAFRYDTAEKVLPELSKEFKVRYFTCEKELGLPQGVVNLLGSKAVMLLNQIKKHLVIKRQLAEWLVSVNGKSFTEDEIRGVREKLKQLRADQTLSGKVRPSNQWLAGYIDGDGCFTSVYDKKYGGIVFRLMITSHKNDPQAVELVRRHYGGMIQVRKDQNLCYVLSLADRGAAEKLFKGVLPHIKVKRAQADLIQGVLRNGRHLKKNGATPESNKILHDKLKSLKKPNRPQRLSEITPEGEAIVCQG